MLLLWKEIILFIKQQTCRSFRICIPGCNSCDLTVIFSELCPLFDHMFCSISWIVLHSLAKSVTYIWFSSTFLCMFCNSCCGATYGPKKIYLQDKSTTISKVVCISDTTINPVKHTRMSKGADNVTMRK